jgi:hypothetical protein
VKNATQEVAATSVTVQVDKIISDCVYLAGELAGLAKSIGQYPCGVADFIFERLSGILEGNPSFKQGCPFSFTRACSLTE